MVRSDLNGPVRFDRIELLLPDRARSEEALRDSDCGAALTGSPVDMFGGRRWLSTTAVAVTKAARPPVEAWVHSLQTGQRTSLVELPGELFSQDLRRDLLQRAVRWHLAAIRGWSTAKTKGRGEVSGGGRKPHAQKGTGRARQGSTRSPVNRGGGHAHAKVPRDFSFDLNKKVRRLAVRVALSTRFHEGNVIVVDNAVLDTYKTKEAVRIQDTLGLHSALIVAGNELDRNARLAIRNVPGLNLMKAQFANVLEIIKAKKLVLTLEAVHLLQARLCAEIKRR